MYCENFLFLNEIISMSTKYNGIGISNVLGQSQKASMILLFRFAAPLYCGASGLIEAKITQFCNQIFTLVNMLIAKLLFYCLNFCLFNIVNFL